MKARLFGAACLLAVLALSFSTPAPAQEQKTKTQALWCHGLSVPKNLLTSETAS